MFISSSQAPYWRFPQDCSDLILTGTSISELRYYFDQLGYVPYNAVTYGGQVIGYEAARPECVDCRSRGGSLRRPDYW